MLCFLAVVLLRAAKFSEALIFNSNMSNFKPGGANSIHHPRTFGKEKVKYTFGLLGAPFEKGQEVALCVSLLMSSGRMKARLGGLGGDDRVSSKGSHYLFVQWQQSLSLGPYSDTHTNTCGDSAESWSISQLEGRDITTFPTNAIRLTSLLQSRVSSNVQDILSEGRVSVTLGGDHSISIGTIDAHMKSRGPVAVIWVDAHGDINTPDTSPSGNIHGMPLAVLSKELVDYWPDLPVFSWLNRSLSVRNIAIIALRDVDREERAIMDKFSIATYSMHHIDKLGVVNVVQEALSRIDPTSSLPLHISFDIDSLDPLEAPSTGTAVRGGITLREGIQLIEEVYNTGRLSAFDMTEVNLRLGNIRDSQLTLEAAKHLLRAVFGHQRRGDLPNETLISKLKSYK
uniref:Arginase n=2 Tax=Timema TaxID=61471 RepID=A0A7R9I9Y7_9NEOP|nr:unnamed protein product [Timema bartmani]CAD7453128.1 unnamed protein product [Timema tahoe]